MGLGRYALYPDDRCAVYRCLDEHGKLVYVGISSNPNSRWTCHKKKVWWDLVADIKVRWYGSRHEAKRHETRLIKRHRPPANIDENGDHWDRELTRVKNPHRCQECGADAYYSGCFTNYGRWVCHRCASEFEQYARAQAEAQMRERGYIPIRPDCVECGAFAAAVADGLCQPCRNYQYEAV